VPRSPTTDKADFYEELGRRIAELRRSRSMSQERLGETADVGVSYLAHIEVGSRRPTLDVLMRIANALDVALWRLITDDRLSHDEIAWQSVARELGEKVRGLSREDLQTLGYLADRMRSHRHTTYGLRAAESKRSRNPSEGPATGKNRK
jgi:transcriptional regulator with XRE-family HTH domain